MGLRICTTNLGSGESLQIVAAMQVFSISWKMSTTDGDAGSLTGNATIRDADGNDIASEAVALGPGDGDVFVSNNPNQPIDGITISCTTGTLRVIMAQG